MTCCDFCDGDPCTSSCEEWVSSGKEPLCPLVTGFTLHSGGMRAGVSVPERCWDEDEDEDEDALFFFFYLLLSFEAAV